MQDDRVNDAYQLPNGWLRPVPLTFGGQLSLFPATLDDLGVTDDEFVRWRRNGWLSFDCVGEIALSSDQQAEVEFIKTVARAGLDSGQIDLLLAKLDAPFQYDPMRVAYNFLLGWVQTPPVPTSADMDELIDSGINGWLVRRIEEADIVRMHDLIDTIRRAIDRARKRNASAQNR